MMMRTLYYIYVCVFLGYIKLSRDDSDETVCGTDVTPQDGSACDGQTQPIKVCGTCGILYDNSYPLNAVAF